MRTFLWQSARKPVQRKFQPSLTYRKTALKFRLVSFLVINWHSCDCERSKFSHHWLSVRQDSSRLKSTFLDRVCRSFTNFLGSLTCILWSGIHNPIFDRVDTSPWHSSHQKIYTLLEVWVIPTQQNCFSNHNSLHFVILSSELFWP